MRPCWNNIQCQCLQLEAPSPPATLSVPLGSGPMAEYAPGVGGWHGPRRGCCPGWGHGVHDSPQVWLSGMEPGATWQSWDQRKSKSQHHYLVSGLEYLLFPSNITLIPVSQTRAGGWSRAGRIAPQSPLCPPAFPCVCPNTSVPPWGCNLQMSFDPSSCPISLSHCCFVAWLALRAVCLSAKVSSPFLGTSHLST